MKKALFSIIGVLGYVLILWSAGETDGSVFSETQAFLMGIAGVAMLVIGIGKGKKKKTPKHKSQEANDGI